MGDGTEVLVHVDGREHPARAILEEDPDCAAEALKKILDQGGADAFAVTVDVDRPLTVDEMRPLLASRAIAYVKLTD